MISAGSSAVENMPVKKSSASMLALVGDDGGAEPEAGGRIVGVRVVVGDRAADGAAVAHRRIADHAGELGDHRHGLLHHRRGVHVDMAGHRADGERARRSTRCRPRPSMRDRSISCGGSASRSFIVGSSVWPPARSLASSFLLSRLVACRSVSRAMEGEAVHLRFSVYLVSVMPRAAACGLTSATPPTLRPALPAWRWPRFRWRR